MPPQTTRRQPLSCENCRKRKIKCSGKRPPCETCTRRGFADTCHYLRFESQTESRKDMLTAPGTQELVDRISSLEALLHQYIAGQPSVPLTPVDLPFPASSMTDPSLCSVPTTSTSISSQLGNLETSLSGHQRYVPHAPLSIAANVNQVFHPMLQDGLLDASPLVFDGGDVIRRQDLIALLPPGLQCDELQTVFFQVFSPVSSSVFLTV